MHRERIRSTACFHIIIAVFLIGCLSLATLAAAEGQDGSIRVDAAPPGGGACLDSTDNSGNCQAIDSTGYTEFFNIPGDSSHTVSIYLDGYQPYTTTVYVSPGQEAEVRAVLQPVLSPSATTAAGTLPVATPAATITTLAPGLLQGIIVAIRDLISGAAPANTAGQPGPVSTGTPEAVTPHITTPASLPEATTPANGKIVGAYFFILDNAYDASMSVKDTIPWMKVNRVYIAFATVHDGVLTDFPSGSSPEDSTAQEENAGKIRNVVALARQSNPDAVVLISSNFGGDMDNEYLRAAQDPQKFADSVVAYMKKYDLDGYDMDWESYQINEDAPQLTTLLSTCHATFAAAGSNPHGHPYILTHTVWPGVESPETVAGLKDSVDQVNIMSYGSGDTYDLVSYADSYAQAGFPYEMMIGGLENEDGYTDGGGPDTRASVAAKCAYVKEHNLAGLFEWRMDNDMRSDDGPPSFQVTGWMSDCLAQ
jgi:hypothetical protein